MRPFFNANVSWHGTNVEAYTSHIILYMLHVTTKPYSSRNGEIVHIDSPLIHVRVHSIVFYSNHCFMWLSSYALRCETGRWGTSDESSQLCVLCPKQVPDSKYQPLIQRFAFGHIQLCFPQSSTKPNVCTNFSHNHNVLHSRLQHSLVKLFNIESRNSLESHLLHEM